MASFAQALRIRASNGDLVALEEILCGCRKPLRQPLKMLPLILEEAIMPNLQLSRIPTEALRISKQPHLKWFKASLLSLEILSVSLITNYGDIDGQDPSASISPSDVPASLKRLLQRYFWSHLGYCLQAVIEGYILDDIQTALDSHTTAESVFKIVSELLDVLWVTMHQPQETVASQSSVLPCISRLFFRYIDRYIDLVDVLPAALGNFAIENPDFSVHENEGRFLSVVRGFLRQMELQRLNTRGQRILVMACPTLIHILAHSSSLMLKLKCEYPEIQDVLLEIWKTALDVNDDWRSSLDPRDGPPETYAHHSALRQCIGGVGTIMNRGGCKMQRRAVKKHLLKLVKRTVTGLPASASSTIITLQSLLKSLYAYLAFLSVLAPVLKALGKMSTLDLIPWGHSPEQIQLVKAWRNLSQHAMERSLVLKEYREFSLPRESPLCGNPEVCIELYGLQDVLLVAYFDDASARELTRRAPSDVVDVTTCFIAPKNVKRNTTKSTYICAPQRPMNRKQIHFREYLGFWTKHL